MPRATGERTERSSLTQAYRRRLGTQMVAAKQGSPPERVNTGLTVGPCRPCSPGQPSTRAATSSGLPPFMLATTL